MQYSRRDLDMTLSALESFIEPGVEPLASRCLCRLQASFTAQAAGTVSATLQVNDEIIRQWNIRVVAGQANVSMTMVSTPQGPITAGQKAALRVRLLDSYGNVVPSTRKADFNGTALAGPVNINATMGELT